MIAKSAMLSDSVPVFLDLLQVSDAVKAVTLEITTGNTLKLKRTRNGIKSFIKPINGSLSAHL